MKKEVYDTIIDLLRLTTKDGHPNISQLWEVTRNINILSLNIKNFGYEIARELAKQMQSQPGKESAEIKKIGITSKLSTQEDIESFWFTHWCNQIKAEPIYHRKLWEFAFVLQVLYEMDMLKKNTYGLGFGCGEEPLASYFAANKMRVTITDLDPEKSNKLGWLETNQHLSYKEKAFYPEIVDKRYFDDNVDVQYVDMNNIDQSLTGYDFCWSVCALEHLGSINQGLDFIINSMKTLKPGGVAVHTTEFNVLSNDETINNWATVLFRKKDFEQLEKQLTKHGYKLSKINFDTGNQILDRFIDIPPYEFDHRGYLKDQWQNVHQNAHLKLSIDGFVSTCIGLKIEK